MAKIESATSSDSENNEDSTSESESSCTDDEELTSTSSSPSSGSDSDGAASELIPKFKIKGEYKKKPTPVEIVPEITEHGKVKSDEIVDPNVSKVKEPVADKDVEDLRPPTEEKSVVEAVPILSDEIHKHQPVEEIPQIIPTTEVVFAETTSKITEQEEGELDPEPETINNENIVELPIVSAAEPAENVETNVTEDGEPEAKKTKLEEVTVAPSKPTEAVQLATKDSDSKEASRRRSSRDRSRSQDRRYKRRSRERDERSRRQRSRSRSRDRRRRRSRTRSRSKGRNRAKSQDRRRGKSPQKKEDDEKDKTNDKITERQRRTVDLLTSRTGGAYIPPAKLRMMQAEITDKASAAYQRIAWEALKKSIHGYINKVNVDNIGIITRELLKENIVRGRGLLCRSIIQAQAASPTFTHVYSALVAIINSKFPNIGELLLKRLVIQFKRAFRRNDKAICLSASRFVAHLVNQRVAHEILALEILTLLVETPTDDSVEVAIAFLKECGMKLTEVSSKGIGAIFEMLKNILHEGKLDKRVQYMIEVVFQVRKDGFKDHQSVIEALELVEEDDQFTHLMMLDEATTTEDNLNAFKFDDKYETNEDKYKGLSKEILGSDASDSNEDGSGSGSDDSDSEEDEEEKAKAEAIIDNTETNLVALRRTIYLTINSSLDYEECAHKLMKMQLKPGQEIELCHMFLDCCAEQRTYEKFYGLLAQRFCSINKTYIEPFEEIFKDTYQTTHRLDTNRLRNVSKFFAHLLFTDAIGWDVIDCIKLNEDDTTSSSRIFIKILFQELAEYMGLGKLNSKLKDEVLVESLAGLFPKDNPRNSRFSINFFTSIGLGGLTDDLRQFLKNAPKNVPAINSELLPEQVEVSSTTSSSSSSSSSSTSSSSNSSSESSSSEDEKEKRNKKKKKKDDKKKSLEKPNKKKSKPEPKNKKSKKHETSSSDSSESSSSSSSSSESSTSSSGSSEDDKKKKKMRSSKKEEVSKKKSKKEKSAEPSIEKEERRGKDKDKHMRRDKIEASVRNGRSENGHERERGDQEKNGRDRRDRERNEREKGDRGRNDREKDDRERSDRERNGRERAGRDRNDREKGDRKDNRMDRSPNRDRRHRDNYNQSVKSSSDVRSKGKSGNGSKERG